MNLIFGFLLIYYNVGVIGFKFGRFFLRVIGGEMLR